METQNECPKFRARFFITAYLTTKSIIVIHTAVLSINITDREIEFI